MIGAETEAGTDQLNEADVKAEVNTGQVKQIYANQTAPKVVKPAVSPRLILAVIGILVAGLVVVGLVHTRTAAGPTAFQDLGAGISNATGLKGSLKARWQGKGAEYQLEIEPIDPLQSAGFSYVAANPPVPLFLHMKLLDATGYAVCGKDVLFPFDPASPGEKNRERGQDMLQSSLDPDGKVVSLSAEGILPCTAGQYKQVVYWDISTNFPALAEQDELMKRTAAVKNQQEAKKQAVLRRLKASRPTFYMEGDDWVAGYDASRNLLETRLSMNFLVTGPGPQSMARQWAGSDVLFHYKCDQRSNCVLTRAGGLQSLLVTVLQ